MTPGTMSFGWMRLKWSYLAIMHSAVFEKQKKKHSILAQIPHTNYQAWWWRGGDLGILQSLSRP